MTNDNQNPDYLDQDWTVLIQKRREKWADMMANLGQNGFSIHLLWENAAQVPDYQKDYGQPIPSLAVWPIQPGRKGTVIVCAGGGFMFKSPNEAKPVAEAFHQAGLNAAILDYRYSPYSRSAAGSDGQRAIRYLRCHAGELGIDPDHIAIGGFSAGGMVTSMVINGFDAGRQDNDDPVERVSSRPDAAFQMYGSFRRMPDLSASLPKHPLQFSFDDQNRQAREDYILSLPMDAPPLFMAQTDADDPHHVLQMALAYADRGIPHECHLFHGGPHGGALFDGRDEDTPEFPHTAHWITLASEWFVMMGF